MTTTTGRPAIGGAQRRQAGAVQQQVLLAAQELAAVVGEALELADHALPGRAQRGLDARTVEDPAGRHGLVADVHAALVDADAGPVLDRGQAVGADAVDERHPGLGEHLGTEVRVAAGDQVAGVHDGRHAGRRRGPGRSAGRGPGRRGRRRHRAGAAAAAGRPVARRGRCRGRREGPRPGGGGTGVRKSSSRPMLSTATGRWPQAVRRVPPRRVRTGRGRARPSRAARARGPGRCRTRPRRRTSATARARGPRGPGR